MPSKDTLVTLLIGAGGVLVAAALDALGTPPIAASLLGLGVVILALVLRRQLRGGG